MPASARPSSDHHVVDEPLLRRIAAEILAAIPGAVVPLFGSCARVAKWPDSDLDLLVTVPDEWLTSHSRCEKTGELSSKPALHRTPIDLLLFVEAYRYGADLHAG